MKIPNNNVKHNNTYSEIH